MPYTNLRKKAYTGQKNLARGRGIPFLLSFYDWWSIWNNSGHWHERGIRKGQYVMSRPGDKGPYTVNNVKIILTEENCRQRNINKKCVSNAKLTPKIVKEIRKIHVKNSHGKNNTASLAKKYGVEPYTILRQ